jgi:hypothetical protein
VTLRCVSRDVTERQLGNNQRKRNDMAAEVEKIREHDEALVRADAHRARATQLREAEARVRFRAFWVAVLDCAQAAKLPRCPGHGKVW